MIVGLNSIIKKSVVSALLFTATGVYAQQNLIKDEFLAIRPGISTKQDVRDKYGELEIVNYSSRITKDFQMTRIDYARGDCAISAWSFPAWVVEKVIIFPRDAKTLRLKDVILDERKFQKRQAGDVLTNVEYSNEEAGISIEYDRKMRRVESIELKPPSKLQDKHACN